MFPDKINMFIPGSWAYITLGSYAFYQDSASGSWERAHERSHSTRNVIASICDDCLWLHLSRFLSVELHEAATFSDTDRLELVGQSRTPHEKDMGSDLELLSFLLTYILLWHRLSGNSSITNKRALKFLRCIWCYRVYTAVGWSFCDDHFFLSLSRASG